MYQNERLDKIMELLGKYSYVSVKFLTDELDYSTATINRDLNLLQNKGLIKRSYGGIELVESANIAPLPFRYHKMQHIKDRLGKAAAELISDGDTVFIDGATTTESIGKYLSAKNDITVITNNVALFLYLSERKTDCVILGGRTMESPFILGGNEVEANALKYKADKMFFSSSGFTESGEIHADQEYELLRRIMRSNSKECYYLADHNKYNNNLKKVLFKFDELTGIISDYDFSDDLKNKYINTSFILPLD